MVLTVHSIFVSHASNLDGRLSHVMLEINMIYFQVTDRSEYKRVTYPFSNDVLKIE